MTLIVVVSQCDNSAGLSRHGHHACVRPGVGYAEATYALPRPRVAHVTGQDSETLPGRCCEGRHLLSRGQPINNNNNNNNKSISTAPNRSRLLSGALQNIAN